MVEFAQIVSSPDTVNLFENSSGQPIDINVGDVVYFSIKENPSTGYKLIVDQITSEVFQYDSRYEPYVNYLTTPIVGAGGTRVFKIVGNSVG